MCDITQSVANFMANCVLCSLGALNATSQDLQIKMNTNPHVFLSLCYEQVTRFQLTEPTKMSSSSYASRPNRVVIKEEKIDEDFVSPSRPTPYSRPGHHSSDTGRGSQRVPCSIQKVPSLSDLSDPESSSSLGKWLLSLISHHKQHTVWHLLSTDINIKLMGGRFDKIN